MLYVFTMVSIFFGVLFFCAQRLNGASGSNARR